MTRSMTGYGRAVAETSLGKLVIETHSVNRRTLEINLQAGKEFLPLDLKVRKKVAEHAYRGQVTVRIARELGDVPTGELLAQQLLLLKNEWEAAAKKVGLSGEVTLSFLAEQLATVPPLPIDNEEVTEKLLTALVTSLKKMTEMKESEGESLTRDIHLHLEAFGADIDLIERESKNEPDNFRARVEKRLKECELFDEERTAREVALLAEKADVTEEVVRLRSHIDQFNAFLTKKDESIGRSLDFIMQEMNREANTITSKAQSTQVKQAALNLKSGIEKIREQVQNIE